MNRRIPLLLAALLAAALAGCGVRPSGVITGGPAPVGSVDGVRIYLLSDGEPTMVLRGLKPLKLDGLLGELAAGPSLAEQRAGFSSEVPAEITPVKIGVADDGMVVSVSTDVRGLSVLGTLQIVCTVQAVSGSSPVTLVSDEQRRGPLSCPVSP